MTQPQQFSSLQELKEAQKRLFSDLSNPTELIKLTERLYPQIYAKANPRSYAVPDGWPSPKHFATLCANSYLNCKNSFHVTDSGKMDTISLMTYIGVAKVLSLGVPTYFIGRDLLYSASHTDLPASLRLNDIKWPIDAMLFVLPRKALITPAGGDTLYIGVCRAKAMERLSITDERTEEGAAPKVDTVTVFAYVSEAASYCWTHPLNDDLVISHSTDPILECFVPEIGNDSVEFKPKQLEEPDREFNIVCTKVGLQLLLAMVARPDLIESSRLIRKGKMSKGTQHRDLWFPNFVGRLYQLARSTPSLGGTHSAPRTHWRRGHFRVLLATRDEHGNVTKDSHWKKDETLWIEPTLVNPVLGS